MRTYKLPSKKITNSDNFCAMFTCNLMIGPTGRHKIAISVTIFGIALPMNEALRLMQVPSIQGIQAFLIGWHWNMHTAQIAIHQPITTAAMRAEANRKFRDGKMRRYIDRRASLMSITAVT